MLVNWLLVIIQSININFCTFELIKYDSEKIPVNNNGSRHKIPTLADHRPEKKFSVLEQLLHRQSSPSNGNVNHENQTSI